ncbi:ATP-binding protein [Spirochaetia bacterium]|nr:ATP-binding protein [Spirochaetia bacterium]
MADKELDIRKQEDLVNALNLADSVVYKTYLSYLNQMEIVECPSELQDADLNDFTRFFKVERFIYEKNENSRDKLVSVFHSVASCGGSVIVIIDSDGKKINYYFGTKVALDADISPGAEVLRKSLSGNFPGTKISGVPSGSALNSLTGSVFKNHRHSEQQKQICTVTGIAGLRAKEENHEKLFIQGMEKLVDSMRGETYSLLLIADPVSMENLQIIKRGYENLYSQLVPFSGSELNFGQNESASVSNSVTEGLSNSINKSVTDTLTHTKGTSESHTDGITETKGKNINPGGIAGLLGGAIGFLAGGPIGMMLGGAIGGAVGGTVGFNSSTSKNESDSHSTSKSVSKSKAHTDGTTETTTEQETKTETNTEGTSRNIQLKFESKAVKNLLEKIDLQLKRLDASADTGMWNCSVYCLADDSSTCKIVASSYQALLRGENSSIETGAITEWTEPNAFKILPWLEKMHHPKLLLANNKIEPASFISGTELTIHAGIPQSSVGGLPVLEMAPFGREVSAHWQSEEQYGNKINLGKIYHMGNAEDLPVVLNKNSLCSHTFITGSTGSGKSNTIYQLLNEIKSPDCNFLVVEPAKGEYKNVFDNKTEVSVYGTNPAKTPLLRINPFTFPDDIHVLEHLDRLVEIFNVCWPMYAAMPAVLKNAIEASYEEAGWDLRTSKNKYPQKLYPTFADVMSKIVTVINSSEYSEENKGNYKGALVTRLESLANGINGMIFTNDELANTDLFDKNVIVDLSRVGSMETKALIMGLLVMKLQEYRMTSEEMNADLKHITVLEEAHTLLKRTSTEQSSESSNLLGKSVEMLANAIAEMRTYGEGFIIADQSPGLLDMSVIRNTNTKIILCLPDESDRELVGKAASLNDDQIVELARLQKGIAAVYQNDWLQPVLCQVEHFKIPKTKYTFDSRNVYQDIADTTALDALKKRIACYLLSNIAKEPPNENIDTLKEHIFASSLETGLKTQICDYLDKRTLPTTIDTITDIIAGMYRYSGKAIERAQNGFPITREWAKDFFDEVTPRIDDLNKIIQQIIMHCLIADISNKNKQLSDLPNKWSEMTQGRTL